jgi:2'-5' RNA ligase
MRLGVALLVPSPVREEVDALRRALGDPALDRVPAHLTLVPPVNVRTEALPAAMATLRRAAAEGPRRLTLTLGPPATFLPANPVLYLEVGGDLDALRGLRSRVFGGPLERPLIWPFVPHVTLADGADPRRIEAALLSLAQYRSVATFETVHLLREGGHGADRRWSPIADAALGSAVVVGRGGLALQLVRSHRLDPEAAELVSTAGVEPAGTEFVEFPGRTPIVITARREGGAVGVGVAWLTVDGGQVCVLVAGAHRGQGIGGHVLAAVESAVADAGWQCRTLHALGPPEFYAARSSWSVADAVPGPVTRR